MMTKTAVALLLVAIGCCCAVAVAQPPPPPPPAVGLPTMLVPPVEIGLLAAAQSRIGALGLMTVGRALSKDEQAQIQDAHEVAELLGAGGRNFLGPISKLARERGIFQESIRALQRGEYQQAQLGLWYTVCILPDAKIVHRELATAYLQIGDFGNARGHWAVSVGYTPPEDEVFVGLVKMTATDDEFSQSRLPELLPTREDRMPSIATLSRPRAALSLAGNRELADGGQLAVEKQLEGDNKYPELAAAAVVELTLAAAKALMEGENFAGRSQVVERLHVAAINACDGNLAGCANRLWRDRRSPRFDAGGPVEKRTGAAHDRPMSLRWVPLFDDGSRAGKLVTVAHAIAYHSASYQVVPLPAEVREEAEQMTDLPVLQALLAHPGK